jgi:hypothetical protein
VGDQNLAGIQLVLPELGKDLARPMTLMNITQTKRMTREKIPRKLKMRTLIEMGRNQSESYTHVHFPSPGKERSHCASGHHMLINGV